MTLAKHIVLVSLIFGTFSQNAEAQTAAACAPYPDLASTLLSRYQELELFNGSVPNPTDPNQRGTYRVFANITTGTWTGVLQMGEVGCIIMTGRDFKPGTGVFKPGTGVFKPGKET